MIKSTALSTKFTNKNKRDVLSVFLADYRNAVEFYVDYLWNQLDESLVVDKFMSTAECFPDNTNLTQRALKCASTQACGIVRAATVKRRKQLYMLEKLTKEGRPTRFLQKKIEQNQLVRPSVPKKMPAELNSICANLGQSKNTFDRWLTLSSIGYGKVIIPLKQTRHSKKLMSSGKELTSFLITEKSISCRYELLEPKIKTDGIVLGADQGLVTCLSLSDKQVTPKCRHGHDLKSIIEKLSRKKKGSKSFRKVQNHRTNYVNWSIKQLNLTDVKEIKLEKLFQMRSGVKTNRPLSHWTYTEIRDKLSDRCKSEGIKLTEQDNVYRSQRCSSCGFVHKANRKGKELICRNCGEIHDADINSAMNHEQELVELPDGIRHLKLNSVGFFWTTHGVFDLDGQEITVPVENRSANIC